MRKSLFLVFFISLFLSGCNSAVTKDQMKVVTVSIPPYKYFVEAIADSDFVVNVMLPPGADHHTWEPSPRQISSLAASDMLFINGHLGFELAWIDRFREVNQKMKVIDLSEGIQLIEPSEEDEDHHGHSHEGADPHYWLSPREAGLMASTIADELMKLNPSATERYKLNFVKLKERIAAVDSIVNENCSKAESKSFMIFHPALSYLARDYGLEQISFEDEGKMPSPARLKELIDMTRSKGMKTVFVQKEYDIRSAKVLASETGTRLVIIDPMNPEWDKSVIEISKSLTGEDGK